METPQPVMAHLNDRVALAAKVRAGSLTRLRRGAYMSGESAIGLRELAMLRIRAVEFSLTVEHVFSHASAALIWGLPAWRSPNSVHLYQGYRSNKEHSGDIVRHFGLPEDSVRRDALPVTTLVRTTTDCLRTLSPLPALVIADAALQRGLDKGELEAQLGQMAGHRGVARARRVLELADGGSESPWETWLRYQILRLGLPQPVTQYPVSIERTSYRLDLFDPLNKAWFEFDGASKYDDRAYGTEKSGREVVIAEKRREEAIAAALGCHPLRVMASDSRRLNWLESRIRSRYSPATLAAAKPLLWMPPTG